MTYVMLEIHTNTTHIQVLHAENPSRQMITHIKTEQSSIIGRTVKLKSRAEFVTTEKIDDISHRRRQQWCHTLVYVSSIVPSNASRNVLYNAMWSVWRGNSQDRINPVTVITVLRDRKLYSSIKQFSNLRFLFFDLWIFGYMDIWTHLLTLKKQFC